MVYVSSLVIQEADTSVHELHYKKMRKSRMQREAMQEEFSLDDLLAEKERREAYRKYQSSIDDISDADLDERIRRLRNRR